MKREADTETDRGGDIDGDGYRGVNGDGGRDLDESWWADTVGDCPIIGTDRQRCRMRSATYSSSSAEQST